MLVVAPFFIKSAPVMSPMGSWSFYLKIVAIVAACIYGIKPTFKLIISAIVISMVAFTAKSPFTENSWYQIDYFLFALLLFGALSSHKLDEKTIYKSLSIVCLLSTIWLWLNYFGIDLFLEWLKLLSPVKRETLKPLSYVINGSLSHINHSAALIAATIPFLKRKLWIFPVLTVCVFGSALPIACMVFGGVFYLWKITNNKNYLYALGLIVSTLAMAVLFGAFSDYSALGSNGRVDAWAHIIKWTWFNFLGQGFGAMGDYFTLTYKSVSGEIFYQAHNELIEAYVIGGIPLITLFIWLAKDIFKRNDFIPASTCCFILLINSLGNFTFQVVPLLIVFLTCYTLITFQGEKKWQQ